MEKGKIGGIRTPKPPDASHVAVDCSVPYWYC